MNSRVLINLAIGLYGIYNIFQQATSSYSVIKVFGITMNKWIYVAIWAAIVYSCFSSLYKWYKYQQKTR